MRMIQQMQQRLLKAQEDLANEAVQGTAGGGAVAVTVSGHLRVLEVTIDPAAVDPEDVETLQDMVLVAANDALARAQDLASRRMGAITGGIKIPGLT